MDHWAALPQECSKPREKVVKANLIENLEGFWKLKKKKFCGHILSWPVPERAILEALLAEGAVLDSEFNSMNIYQIPAV